MEYEEYAENCKQNGFLTIPKTEWTKIKNQIIKDNIYINKMKEVDNQRIDNLLAGCKNGGQ
jgi:hypothetical protein